MTYTDQGTKITQNWLPLALANGMEWSIQRAGFADRFDCLYRHGVVNKVLWHIGARLACLWRPAWIKR